MMNKCNAQAPCNNTKPDLFQYYVVRNKDTGCYYRGKGKKNKWGKYYNQASIYRIKKHAENAAKYLDRYDDEKAEVIEISIVEKRKSNKMGLYKGKSVEDGEWVGGNLLTLTAVRISQN